MINPHRFSIGPAAAEIAMLQWGESGKPPALLVHGTGFVADVWDEVARELASTLWYSDATLQHECTQLINERCPLRDQAPADAMQ